jgi:hypothetical protein
MSLLKSFNCRRSGIGYAKVIHKKEKSIKKGQVSKIAETMGTQMPTMKKEEKNNDEEDSPCFLAEVFQSFNKRGMFQGAE